MARNSRRPDKILVKALRQGNKSARNDKNFIRTNFGREIAGYRHGNLPETVNAFTIPAQLDGEPHRIILLNRAPYSNVPAEKLLLTEEDWLEKSHAIRLRHESAHYETLRLFGGMKNHALDEILADCLGQIAAFGNFDADRQRIFFGLDGDKCTGRLQFYCQKVSPDERPKIYAAVDKFLDKISVDGKTELEILCELARRRLA